MIITIGGKIGAGKTSVAKALAEKLGLKHVSAGMLFRKLAEERKMSIEEFSKLAERDESIDKLIDEKQRELAKQGNVVVDGRLSAAMLDADLKVFLTAPLEIRAERVSERENKSYELALHEIKLREESEIKRYKKIYGIDMNDISLYDLVINTAKFDVDDIVEIIYAAANNIKKGGKNRR